MLLGPSPAACADDVSFKGQTVHLYIGFAPGGSYDYFGRLVARHIGRHLPGTPTVIAEQMPGAGSFTAANFLCARAPKDGTALGIVSQTMAIEEALGTPGVQYKAARFNWIGRATSVNEVSFTFHTSHTKTIAEEEVRQGIARGLDAVLLNPANIVGPYDMNNWSRLIRLAAAGKLPRVPPGRYNGMVVEVTGTVKAEKKSSSQAKPATLHVTKVKKLDDSCQ